MAKASRKALEAGYIKRSWNKERCRPITCKPMRIRAKGRQVIAWMGMASDATSRVWMAGVVSIHRDRALADRLLHQMRACCQGVRALLVCTDGWNAYANSMLRVLREKVKKQAGPGRAG